MATKVLVPLLGEGVEEVTVTKWLKQEGDSIKELEPLLEVNTDKVDTEIPAPASGTVLKIVAQEGLPAKVGTILAFIGKPGENVDVSSTLTTKDEKHKTQNATDNVQSSTTNIKPSTDIGFISPIVAKIAAEHGVNLSQVQGTGLNGRITKNDVMAFIENRESGIARPTKTCKHSSHRRRQTYQAYRHPQANCGTHGDVQAYLAARADRHGSGYEQSHRPSKRKH